MMKLSGAFRKAAVATILSTSLIAGSAILLAPAVANAQMHRGPSAGGFRGGPAAGGLRGRDFDRGFHRDWDDRFRGDWDGRFRGDWDDRFGFGIGFYGHPYYGGYYAAYPYGCDYYDYYYGYCPYY